MHLKYKNSIIAEICFLRKMRNYWQTAIVVAYCILFSTISDNPGYCRYLFTNQFIKPSNCTQSFLSKLPNAKFSIAILQSHLHRQTARISTYIFLNIQLRFQMQKISLIGYLRNCQRNL